MLDVLALDEIVRAPVIPAYLAQWLLWIALYRKGAVVVQFHICASVPQKATALALPFGVSSVPLLCCRASCADDMTPQSDQIIDSIYGIYGLL